MPRYHFRLADGEHACSDLDGLDLPPLSYSPGPLFRSPFRALAKNRAISPPPPSRQGRHFPLCRGNPVVRYARYAKAPAGFLKPTRAARSGGDGGLGNRPAITSRKQDQEGDQNQHSQEPDERISQPGCPYLPRQC
jgi:hypothetical protein